MIALTAYNAALVGVFGLGKAGEAAIAALCAGGAEVYAWDDRPAATSRERVHMLDFKQWPWQRLKALVLSPGVPLTHPQPHPVVTMAKQFGVPVIGDVELLWQACPQAHFVAITGTNGKSTTTTLIGHLLKSAGRTAEIGGNLGTPALALEPLGQGGHYVIETSSYQLDLLKSAHFNVAVWLNITPDHLDRHGSMEGYVAAKRHIFERQDMADVAIIGVDDAYSRVVAESLKQQKHQRVVEISVAREVAGGVYVKDGVLHDDMQGKVQRFDLRSIETLPGKHNWQNAAAAYAAARCCGVAPEEIYKAMQGFAGLRHRLQLAGVIHGVRFINDSKATNADATSNALAAYEPIYWIAGGKPKEGGIVSLAEYFPKITHAFLIGQAEEEFARSLQGKVPYTLCGTLDVALKQAAHMAFTERKKNAVVLLSPACASFDQFKNFEERGDMFCELVETLAAGAKLHAS